MVRQGFLLALLWCCVVLPAQAAVNFASLDKLPPGEQYRQLSLLLLVAGAVDAEFRDLVRPAEQLAAGGMELGLDDYVTPLVRIVDQETLLANASRLFEFARSNQQEIQTRMNEIGQANPILVSMVDVNEIAADAIIIRNAIADSMEYAEFINQAEADPILQRFRVQTLYLRNMMEYNQFEKELAQITDQAIVDLGGRLDAYQRMFDDEVDPELINRRVESAEIMNAQTGDRYDEQAAMRTTELLMMLILMESQVRY